MVLRKSSLVFLVLAAAVLISASSAWAAPGDAKVVTWGWNRKTVNVLVSGMSWYEQNLAFHGAVIDLGVSSSGGTDGYARHLWIDEAVPVAVQTRTAADIATIQGSTSRFWSESYVQVNASSQFSGAPPDWFDAGFNNVITRMGTLAGDVASMGFKGVLFDPEPYQDAVFHYPSQAYSTGAGDGSKSRSQYEAQARARGQQMAQAMKIGAGGAPITMLFTAGNSMAYKDPYSWNNNTYGLYPSFIDGFVAEADAQLTVVDNMQTYSAKTLAQFQTAEAAFTGGAGYSENPTNYLNTVKMGVGPWVDHGGGAPGGTFTPQEFEDAMNMAVTMADYVWVYNEGGFNWWGKDLSDPYVMALYNVTGLPEPSTVAVLGLAGLALLRRRRNQRLYTPEDS